MLNIFELIFRFDTICPKSECFVIIGHTVNCCRPHRADDNNSRTLASIVDSMIFEIERFAECRAEYVAPHSSNSCWIYMAYSFEWFFSTMPLTCMRRLAIFTRPLLWLVKPMIYYECLKFHIVEAFDSKANTSVGILFFVLFCLIFNFGIFFSDNKILPRRFNKIIINRRVSRKRAHKETSKQKKAVLRNILIKFIAVTDIICFFSQRFFRIRKFWSRMPWATMEYGINADFFYYRCL